MEQKLQIPHVERKPVAAKGEFKIAAVGIEHNHIFKMCDELIKAGAELAWVYDADHAKIKQFVEYYPDVKVAASEEEVLADEAVRLVVSSGMPATRYQIALRAMDAGKDFLSDKPPFISFEALEETRKKVKETGRKFFACYGERLYVECVWLAKWLIDQGEIGKVVHVTSTGPHRLNAPSRADWFFDKDQFGGIIADIGTHQIDQYLYLAGEEDAEIVSAMAGNCGNKQYPKFEDFGEVMLRGKNGTTGYFNVDWFTPEALRTWSDARIIVLGTEGLIEVRKYNDIGREPVGDRVFLANKRVECEIDARDTVGYSYFYDVIYDCIHRTDTAMDPEYAFRVSELAMKAQQQAERI